MAKTPKVVFISSTSEDLKQHRQAARDAAISAGFLPVMMEYFVASGKKPPLPACLAKVDDAHLVVAIVAHRYGWAPPDQEVGEHKSITWLECEYAIDQGKEVIPFPVDENAGWPPELRESYRTSAAIEDDSFTPKLGQEVKRSVAKLREFKKWLNSLGLRGTFTTPDDLRGKVDAALREWKPTRKTKKRATVKRARRDDPRTYLTSLRESSAYIDIRGLQVGSGKAHRFPIEDLYIPLTTAATAKRKPSKSESKTVDVQRQARVELHEALTNDRLVIVGDPGSGKTTFLRRIAFALSQTLLGEDEQAANTRLGIQKRPFPIFISVGKLIEHIGNARKNGSRDAPTTDDSPAWLLHFLDTASGELSWGLSKGFFRKRLEGGASMVLLNGLDEAPNRKQRETVARLFERATNTYDKCQFVVTSRPVAYTGKAVLSDFPRVEIDPLERDAVETFLERWSEALFPESSSRAQEHCGELLSALRNLPEVRRMARNPVMLTALAVVHWNERRLPEQRADLYESIITWLLRSREQREGRASTDLSATLLGHLALAMQKHPQGRQIQVSRGWAAEAIATQFRDTPEADRRRKAQQFLDEEEVDSGVVVSHGSEVRFWHLTFQEYLAARAIAGQGEAAQQKLLFTRDIIHREEWREPVLLLAGILHVKQGVDKLDGLFSAVLDRFGKKPSLAERARCVGLLGALLREPVDYKPADPRYQRTLDDVMGIFDAEKSKGIEFQVRLEAAEALGQAGDPRLAKDNWVTIEAGSFLMGARKKSRSEPNYDEEAADWESPVHEVKLDGYRIARYPVTVQEYDRFVEDGGYAEEEHWQAGGFGRREKPSEWDVQLRYPTRPAVNVNWFEASAYCAWADCRLPTEAEWEYAARADTGRKYPWGEEAPDDSRANYLRAAGYPTPVGLYPRGATPDGVHDMAGNVWEWCSDWFDEGYYAGSPQKDPAGLSEGRVRVLRGGSWVNVAWGLRTSNRGRDGPWAQGRQPRVSECSGSYPLTLEFFSFEWGLGRSPS